MIKNVRFNWIRFGLIQNNHSERILTKWIYIRLCYKLRYPNRAIWGKRLWPHTPKIKTNLTGQISNVGSFCNERCLFMTKGGACFRVGYPEADSEMRLCNQKMHKKICSQRDQWGSRRSRIGVGEEIRLSPTEGGLANPTGELWSVLHLRTVLTWGARFHAPAPVTGQKSPRSGTVVLHNYG